MTAMTDNAALHFTKGHGTENDFVLVPDLEGSRDLTVEQVRRWPTGTPASAVTA